MKPSMEIYRKRVACYTKKSERILQEIHKVSRLRILVAIAAGISAIFLSKSRGNVITWGVGLLFAAIFSYLIYIHSDLKKKNQYICILNEINQNSLKRLTGEWKSFEDRGEAFQNGEHAYSMDLDIFGQGSLFQWINTAHRVLGRRKLAQILTSIPKSKAEIEKKQTAIQELSKRRWWRQRFEAAAIEIGEERGDIDNLLGWSKGEETIYSKTWVIWTFRLLPLLTVIMLLLAFLLKIIHYYIPLALLLFQFILLSVNSKKRGQQLDSIYNHKNSIKVYGKMLKHIETTSFRSQQLQELKENLKNEKGLSALEQLKRLEGIVDRILHRNNTAFFPINILLLWDYQCLVAIEDWKKQSGIFLETWLQTLGEIEALCSLALIPHDYPHWCLPHIEETPFVFSAKAIGHPLLTEKQVCNDIAFDGSNRVLLITGSNMSGKSTFLRTLGFNLVLAYAGAPVCAQFMECSLMHIYTCMRISDNLEKSISSFYGELLRIKKIVEATKEKKQIFFLLDEIFKGTNSQDRHLGAKILIQQLYRQGALGLVSTHDLELGEMEQESGGTIKNYHFQEHYEDNQIYFDYRLRPGISKTRNALYLIKMAGVEIGDIHLDENGRN
ncbi:MAG: DNA mismatch repair protein [Thermotaleaceae bacterium]